MMDKYAYATLLAALGFGALLPVPALATDDIHPSLLGALMGDRARAASEVQLADTLQSTGQSTSSSSSASASSSSSVTVTGGKQTKCRSEASAHAKAGDVEDSDHDLKVVEGDGCSAKAESRAVVKPQKPQTE